MKRLLFTSLLAATMFVWASGRVPPFPGPEIVHADLPTPSGAISPSPFNHDFTAGEPVVVGPTNYGFEDVPDLTGWTVINGTAEVVQTGGQSGKYLRISGDANLNPKVESSAFTIQSAGPVWSFYVNTSGISSSLYRLEIATSPYTSWTQIASGSSAIDGWVRVNIDVSSYSGQSVKIRYSAYQTVGFDEGATRRLPNWSRTSGTPYWEPNLSIPATTASLGDYNLGETTCVGATAATKNAPAGSVPGNGGIQSDPFTIPGDAGQISLHVNGSGTGASVGINLYLASEGYGTAHLVFNKTIGTASIYTSCNVLSSWKGQNAKISITGSSGGTISVALGGRTAAMLSTASALIQDLVSPTSGVLAYQHTDLAINGKGIPLEFRRSHFSSANPAQGSLGWGWTHSYESRVTIFSSGDVTLQYPSGTSASFDWNGSTFTSPKGLYDTLVKNGDNTYTLTTNNQLRYNYSTAGQLTSIKDRNNNTITIAYDGSGNISTVTDPSSRQLTFTVNPTTGRITQIADSLSRTVQFGYDANGDLQTVTDVKSGVTEFTYSNHRLSTVEDSLNQLQLKLIYDESGRTAERHDAAGGITCFYYGAGQSYVSTNCPGVSPVPQAGETVKVDPRGNKETHSFDTSFRETGVKDALGNVTLYSYEAPGSLCSPADNGNRCSIKDPLNHEQKSTFDSKGNVLTRTDPRDKVWTYTYTTLNDVDLETDPLNRKTDYIYDSAGNLTRIVRKDSSNAIKALTCYERDSSGLVTATVESTDLVVPTDQCTGNRTLYGYDTYGNQTCLVNARFSMPGQTCTQITAKATFTYDIVGRLESVTRELRQPAGAAESGFQCGAGLTGNNVDEDGDRSPDDGCPSTVSTYDNQNNVLSVTNAAGNNTAYTYDAKGNQRTITDANRATLSTAETGAQCGSAGTGNGVDDDGDTVPDDGCPSAIYTYDPLGRVTKVVDALAQTTTFVHDANGNQTSVTNPKRQPVASSETGAQCGSAGTGNGVDDDADTVKDDGCPSGRFTYDSVNRLQSEVDPLGRTTSYVYWEDSQLKERTDARGLVTKYFPDAAHRPDIIQYWNGGVQVSSVDYAHDDAGNRLTIADSTGTTSYEYDALNRMTSAAFPGPHTVSYTYDDLPGGTSADYPGQRTKVTYPDTKTATYTYEPDGSMKNVTDWLSNVTAYTYDDVSRLTKTTYPNGIERSYTYDNANRLLSLRHRRDAVNLASFSYATDALGNRVRTVSQPILDYRAAIVNDGPVAYWRFGEPSGTNAEDETPNNFDATYQNGITLGTAGAIASDANTAVSADGTNDQVQRSANSAFNTDSFSVEVWVKPTQLRVQGIVIKNATSSWRVFMKDTSGHIEFDALNDTRNCATSTASDVAPLGTYSHVVATYDKTKQEMRIYLNGSLRVTCASVPDVGGTFNTTLTVGGTASKTWKGDLDEAAYYNYALPPAAISDHYHWGAKTYRSLILRDGPKAYWRLGEASGTTAQDETHNDYDATFQNGIVLGAAGAIVGDPNTGVDADGTNDQVQRAATSGLNTDNLSIEAWAKPDQLRIQGLAIKNSTSSWRLFMNDTSGHVEFDALADAKNCSTSGADTLITGTYSHVVATYDKTKQEMRIYLNGSLRATCTAINDIGGTFNSSITIGGAATNTWDGKLDEVAVYSYALTPKAIRDHYSQFLVNTQDTRVLSDGPVAYWRLGEKTGTGAADQSANANDGTYNDGPVLNRPGAIAGDLDTAVEFDALDDSASVAGSPTLNDLGKLSLEGWLYLDGFGEGGLGQFISKSGYQAFVNSSGNKLQFQALRWATDGHWETASSSIQAERWYHVAITYDYGSTANDPKIYLDGKLVTVTETQAPSGSLSSDTGSLYIGNNGVGAAGTRTFDGRIDEVAVYDYVLSPDAVRAHYGDTETYSYDSVYRIMGATYSNGDTQSYTYDAQGNRLTKVHNAATTNYTYDDADEMLTAAGVTYTYDNNGNQTGRGTDTFAWDHENRMTGTTIGGTAATYTYNGDGLRTSRTIGGSTVSYRWDLTSGSPQILQDSSGNTYVYGRDLISRTDSGGSQEYYLPDGLGSTRGLANGAGTVTGGYAYDIFGAVRSQTGSSSNEFKFTGEQVDSTGLQYLRARYYDPEIGRFLSKDPLRFLNRYTYVDNNPANLVDPSGKSPLYALAVALAACAVSYALDYYLGMPNPCDAILDALLEQEAESVWNSLINAGGNPPGLPPSNWPNPFGINQALNCLWQFGPNICASARIIQDEATDLAAEYFRDLGSLENDTFRHCYGSALATLEFGAGVAENLGILHEEYSENDDEARRDLYNNSVGRRYANDASSQNDPKAYVAGKCLQGVSNGELALEVGDIPGP